MGYFQQTDYISNSDLGALKKALYGEGEDIANLQEIFDFGNLVDAMATEEHKLNGLTMVDQNRVVEFTEEKWNKAKLMNEVLRADPVLSYTFKTMRKQHEHYKRLKVIYEGNELIVKARCKTDGDIKKMGLGIDLKTTTAETQEQARAAFFHFAYDRQGAWYMDVGGFERMLYIFVGKKRNKITGQPPIFTIGMERGDDFYESGRRKYSRLAFLYHYMIQSIDEKLLLINI